MLSKNLNDNIRHIREAMGDSSDLRLRKLTLPWAKFGGTDAALMYLDAMSDSNALQQSVIPSLLGYEPATPPPSSASLLEWIGAQVLDASGYKRQTDWDSLLQAMLCGDAILLVDGGSDALAIAMAGYEDRGISDAKNQAVTRGPQEAFTETMHKNITLIRRRIKDSRIRVVTQVKGSITRTNVSIVYLEGIAGAQLVQEVLSSLDKFNLEGLFDAHYFEEFFQKKFTLYPTAYNTERPDTVSAMILEGRVAVIVDGSPYVLVVPALLADFIQSAEDYYQPSYFAILIRFLRMLAFGIASFAPATYIAVTTFHQDLLPMQLLLSLAAQREGIPFPAFVEALLMEITFEILREAGLRMPRAIGQAVSIVGTIVIGQAAVDAGIVSAAMVIIVSITAISSFVLPSYSFTLVVRVQRFFFMMLAATLGFYGIYFGIILLVLWLCSLDSFGFPYLRPFTPYIKKEQRDALFRDGFLYWKKKPSGGGLNGW
ncbi:spore germination protein [Cohnella yongneupensis]|uniref:Spore germination protein n=1 Tax=Cohnella yongneupensis TaxID=425006 RepID=A0ABW0R2Y1_9BACL